MTKETDGMNNMSMSFRADLSANSLLLVQLFPSKKDSEAHEKAVSAMVKQIKEGGARVDPQFSTDEQVAHAGARQARAQ